MMVVMGVNVAMGPVMVGAMGAIAAMLHGVKRVVGGPRAL